MKSFTIDLKGENYPVAGGRLTAILAEIPFNSEDENWKRPAVVIVPDGGYGFVSKRESEPVAHFFLANGFQAFILDYLCADDNVHYPEQLTKLAAAVDFIRKNSSKYCVNPEEIFVVGFSAGGGHLIADLAVEYKNLSETAGGFFDCKPTAVGLGYPVISSRKGLIDEESYTNLLQGYSGKEKDVLLKRLELDAKVSKNTPPAFIWTTAEDDDLPPQNALVFALALAGHKAPYELHVYPRGGHGGSVCNSEINKGLKIPVRNGQWAENCVASFRLFTEEKF